MSVNEVVATYQTVFDLSIWRELIRMPAVYVLKRPRIGGYLRVLIEYLASRVVYVLIETRSRGE